MNSTSTSENPFYAADKRVLFLLLCALTLLLLYIKKAFIENETAAFEFLQDRPEGTVLQIISGLQYLSIPLIYLWKFTVIGFVLWVGCFMFGYRITYSQCWGIVMAAEFVFLIPELIKIGWFMFVDTDPDYFSIRGFYPLSLIHFFDYTSMDKRWAYPLRALNVFEIVYWFALANGVHYFARKEKRIVWWIVACGYILIFLLWLVFYVIVYK
ncbi:sulfate ABC transporter permease [Chryseotalea sanaruensis]|uniref:Sulfate ABC transporter permease n=1 Tax=Chryseotalea sanaruensis TaxID=2482724 RepID=A0A401UB64_9BACT|nr:hypothetical protein [Chryseotalea sanaruensis]GCC52121.1 sulfate ABC transporter permease [Chryseotalea sanaruensis]